MPFVVNDGKRVYNAHLLAIGKVMNTGIAVFIADVLA